MTVFAPHVNPPAPNMRKNPKLSLYAFAKLEQKSPAEESRQGSLGNSLQVGAEKEQRNYSTVQAFAQPLCPFMLTKYPLDTGFPVTFATLRKRPFQDSGPGHKKSDELLLTLTSAQECLAL
jgi:hypothetical protein